MDFFHCNSCFSQLGPQRNRKFCLTSCGHTFCTDCLSLSSSKCKECQSDCKVLPLTKDIPLNLQLYFSDLTKEFKKILKTLLVQNKHYEIYMEEYVPQLESSYVGTKTLLDKTKSEMDVLKKKIELLVTENEQLKREIAYVKQAQTNFLRKTPSRDSQNIFSGSQNFGSRSQSMNNKYIFKPSSSKSNTFLTSSPSNDSLISQPQRLTPMTSLMKSKSTLRDNMKILKPLTPGNRMNQSFVMSTKSPSFTLKGRPEDCSPGSWCSSVSSIKSPFLTARKSYYPKP